MMTHRNSSDGRGSRKSLRRSSWTALEGAPRCGKGNLARGVSSRRTSGSLLSFGSSMNGVIVISVIALSVAFMIDLSTGANSNSNLSQQQQQNSSTTLKGIRGNVESTTKQTNVAKQQSTVSSKDLASVLQSPQNTSESASPSTSATVSSSTTTSTASPSTIPVSTSSATQARSSGSMDEQANGDLSASPSSISTISTARVAAPAATTEAQQQLASPTLSTPTNKLFSTSTASSFSTTFGPERQANNDWSPRNEAAFQNRKQTPKNSIVSNKNAPNNRQQQQQSARKQIDQQQQSTSHSVSFVDPTTAASAASPSNQVAVIKQQQPAKSGSSGNRWTHFGARLRPLTPAGLGTSTIDHHEAATSNSKSTRLAPASGHTWKQQAQPIVVIGQQGGSGNLRQQQAGAIFVSPINGNSLAADNGNGQAASSSSGAVNDDDDDDDLDSEALLYKMMQQQNFLMNPNWQQQQQPGTHNNGQRGARVNTNLNALNGASGVQGQQQHQGSRADDLNDLANSKKVIKLLKSYSHIHQVDDSDDQIRGTYTRLSSHRPAANHRDGHGGDYPNGGQNRRLGGRQKQHIYVSSKPVSSTPGSQTAASRTIGSPYPRGQQQQHRQQQLGSNQLDNSASNGDDYDGNTADSSASPSAHGQSNQTPPPEEEEEFECPNNGIFADTASGCQAYHVCQIGAQVQEKFQCPLGTLFNNLILTCDFAHNVQCNGAPQSARASSHSDEINHVAPHHHHDHLQHHQHESVHSKPQPPPQQQVPRASSQVNQASLVRQQQQQQQQPAGPRQLIIGSPYNRHNQGQQTRGPVVGTYPPQASGSINSNKKKDDDDDDDDNDDPIEPLIAATLPPSTPKQTLAPNRASHHDVQPSRQSAHLSQYPRQELGGNYDSAGASIRPTFASRDEAPTTVGPIQVPDFGAHLSHSGSVAHQPDARAQAFNLVINHVTPVNQQHQQQHNQQHHQQSPIAATTPAVTTLAQPPPVYKSQFKAEAPQQKRYNVKQTNGYQAANSLQNHARNAPNQQQQRQAPSQNGFANSRAAFGQGPQAAIHQPNRQPQQQPQQRPIAPVNQQPQHLSKPINGLIDLTNDKKTNGISSEALNDGLLLIVRHSANSNPIGLSGGVTGHQQSHQNNQHSSAVNQQPGQAFAVDPTIVNHNSPLDAQLFPNVQRTIANLHQQQASTNLIRHQPPPNVQSQQQPQHHHQQQRQYNANNINQRGVNVAGPLPPLEPPRPQQTHSISDLSATEQNNPVNEQFFVASTSATNLVPTVASQQQQQPAPQTPSPSSFRSANSDKNNNSDKTKRTAQQAPSKIIKRTKKLTAAKIAQKPTTVSTSSPVSSSKSSETNNGAVQPN